MSSQARFAEVAALVGDPGRASMLHALLDGRALTATELAHIAGITPQTASGHLSRLTEAGLMTAIKQGRHRYHRLASADVARMMESIMCVATASTPPTRTIRTGPKDEALRAARTCYDHMAGKLAVALTDALIAKGWVEITDDAGVVTETGRRFFETLGIQGLDEASGKTKVNRLFCRPCLDWSERRPHLAGLVGALLCDHSFQNGWVRRIGDSRALIITPKGGKAYRDHFGLHQDDLVV